MNWKKIRNLIKGINENLECTLHEGNPCGTCTVEILKDIEKLNAEVKKEC